MSTSASPNKASCRCVDDACHVWLTSLVVDEDEERRLLAGWPESVQRREGRRPPHRLRESLLAWGSLRIAVSRYVGCAPETIHLSRDPHGRPQVEQPGGLFVSLSHSGDLAVTAVTRGTRVGVDVERIRPLREMALARRFFAPLEADALAALPVEERGAAFFQTWVRKEAYLKGVGAGVPAALSQCSFFLETAELLETSIEPRTASSWSVRDVTAWSGYAAAVAIESRTAAIHVCAL